MIIGYARVSTEEQNSNLQVDALKKAGCEKIYQDKISGAKKERPGLDKALEHLREGDTLVVWRLDRLGRSLKDLIQRVQELQDRGIGFLSLQENIDTTTSGGKLVFHIFGSLAEFERDLIRERTKAGLESARSRGVVGGRRKKLSSKQQTLVRELYEDKKNSIKDICEMLGISKATVYRYLK
jgi:DNA invertase Pin-like site-specific DNA recombinase